MVRISNYLNPNENLIAVGSGVDSKAVFIHIGSPGSPGSDIDVALVEATPGNAVLDPDTVDPVVVFYTQGNTTVSVAGATLVATSKGFVAASKLLPSDLVQIIRGSLVVELDVSLPRPAGVYFTLTDRLEFVNFSSVLKVTPEYIVTAKGLLDCACCLGDVRNSTMVTEPTWPAPERPTPKS